MCGPHAASAGAAAVFHRFYSLTPLLPIMKENQGLMLLATLLLAGSMPGLWKMSPGGVSLAAADGGNAYRVECAPWFPLPHKPF